MNTQTIDFLREKKLSTILNDISLMNWIFKQKEDKQYLKDMLISLEKTIYIIDDKKIEKKYREEIIYLNYLINN